MPPASPGDPTRPRPAARWRRTLPALLLLACPEPAPPPAAPQAGRDDLYAVAIVGADRIVAVGDRGAVYRSDDAGERWAIGRADAPALYSVSLADARHGFAVGRFGAILATRDGGVSWQAQRNPRAAERRHLLAVHALDRARALAVGSFGTRLRTGDGGRTWIDASLVAEPGDDGAADIVLQDVTCRPDGGACWVVGEFGTILHSRDAGRSWERGEIAAEVAGRSVGFAVGASELAPGAARQLAAFAAELADGAAVAVAIEGFAAEREIESAQGDPEALFELIAARVDATRRALAAAGVPSDRLREADPPPWDANDPALLSRYLARRRAARPRVEVSPVHDPVLFSVRFDGDSGGWIAGLGGVVLRNTDGGRGWSPLPTLHRDALFAIAPAAGRAVAAAETRLVEVGTPEARTLAEVAGFLRDVRFAPSDPRLGFAVGQGGRILRTRDGGGTWQQVSPTRRDGADERR